LLKPIVMSRIFGRAVAARPIWRGMRV